MIIYGFLEFEFRFVMDFPLDLIDEIVSKQPSKAMLCLRNVVYGWEKIPIGKFLYRLIR